MLVSLQHEAQNKLRPNATDDVRHWMILRLGVGPTAMYHMVPLLLDPRDPSSMPLNLRPLQISNKRTRRTARPLPYPTAVTRVSQPLTPYTPSGS
jgi:hypothetical protein